jgi:hypothetical protein
MSASPTAPAGKAVLKDIGTTPLKVKMASSISAIQANRPKNNKLIDRRMRNCDPGHNPSEIPEE